MVEKVRDGQDHEAADQRRNHQRIREGDGYLVNVALTHILDVVGAMAEVRALTEAEYERPTDADKVSEDTWARGPEWKKV